MLKRKITSHPQNRLNLFMFSIKAKVVDWKYLRRDAVFVLIVIISCCRYFFMYPRVFFSSPHFFSFSYIAKDEDGEEMRFLCTIFSHPVTKIFSPSAFFLYFLKQEKVSTKNCKMSQTMKSFPCLFGFLLLSIQQRFASEFHGYDFN